METFDYTAWEQQRAKETGASPLSISYYCLMLALAPGRGEGFSSVGEFLKAKGLPYKPGSREFEHVEALWDHLYPEVKQTFAAEEEPSKKRYRKKGREEPVESTEEVADLPSQSDD